MGLLAKVNVRAEMKRRKTIRMTMLQMFEREGEINTYEMLRYFGSGHSTRRTELKRDGHLIVPVYEKPGKYRYIYLGKNEDDGTRVSMID